MILDRTKHKLITYSWLNFKKLTTFYSLSLYFLYVKKERNQIMMKRVHYNFTLNVIITRIHVYIVQFEIRIFLLPSYFTVFFLLASKLKLGISFFN